MKLGLRRILKYLSRQLSIAISLIRRISRKQRTRTRRRGALIRTTTRIVRPVLIARILIPVTSLMTVLKAMTRRERNGKKNTARDGSRTRSTNPARTLSRTTMKTTCSDFLRLHLTHSALQRRRLIAGWLTLVPLIILPLTSRSSLTILRWQA